MDKIEEIIKKDAVLVKKHLKGLKSNYDKFSYLITELSEFQKDLVSIESFDLPLLKRESISKERKLEIEHKVLLVKAKINFFKQESEKLKK